MSAARHYPRATAVYVRAGGTAAHRWLADGRGITDRETRECERAECVSTVGLVTLRRLPTDPCNERIIEFTSSQHAVIVAYVVAVAAAATAVLLVVGSGIRYHVRIH